MPLPLVSAANLKDVTAERDEWKSRAVRLLETLEHHTEGLSPRAGSRRRPTVLATAWVLVIGILVGGAVIPHKADAPSVVDGPPACISASRYEHLLAENHHELVNALYDCIEGLPVG